MDYSHIITVDPARRFGQPTVRGMRITVYDVLDWLGGGMSVEQIIEDFPELTREDVQACIAYAADQLRPKLSAARP